MLTCIACSKQLVDADDDGGPHGGPGGNKPAVKSLTSQIKDVVLKLSGVYRPPPGRGVGPSSSSSSFRSKTQFHRSYYYDDGVEDLVSHGGVGDYYYPYGSNNNSSSTAGKGSRPMHDSWTALEGGGPAIGNNGQQGSRGKVAADGSAGFPVLLEDEVEEEPKEWVAQVEPGVHITFVSLPEGGNDLKRIRFSREMFNKWQAQRWWGENYDRVMELYNVQRFNRQALPTPPRSEDERDLSYSRMGSTRDSPVATNGTAIHPYNNKNSTTTINTTNNQQVQQIQSTSRPPTASSSTGTGGRGGGPLGSPAPDPTEHFFPPHLLQHQNNGGKPTLCAGAAGGGGGGLEGIGGACSSVDAASRTTTSSRDDAASVSVSNASDLLEVTEWVEQDEPGVYITIRQMADGSRDLRRVRFSRERFGEVNAKLWWEENRDRIHAQYL